MRAIAKDTKSRILKEQFIPDHVFIYIAKGGISFFDGNKTYILNAGDGCIARKNQLAKFILLESEDEFEPIIFCFEEAFLRTFQQKHKTQSSSFKTNDAFIEIRKTDLMDNFILSLKPYYKGIMELDEAFQDLKYEELLIILLKQDPDLAAVFFDFGIPEKINLEAFMNKNFKFNVSIKRFAFLTGRSLSSFKRDFKAIFNDSPSHWLVKRRLQEAYLLIEQKNEKPSDIYLDLGFESISHFSVAFKKCLGCHHQSLLLKNESVKSHIPYRQNSLSLS
ncbi:helix-turn-helix domain-containing protein [Chondrinema litorale]|uniref:helix-turn-helix domain-containing protein n=1 Tax=Chondrinema litorale TaxID=2994555 RepID=UPI002543C2FD|nr:AraC family transcriptional regulator [Chondrinema litorale]UZR97189.1 AraC family transcriptional regulator [Chondrinema litorale]